MAVTQEILLPVLLAAIVANTVILLLVVVAARMDRRHKVGPAATRSVLQGSLMSTSYIDRSSSSPWNTNGDIAGGADDGARDELADAQDAQDAHAPADGDRASDSAAFDSAAFDSAAFDSAASDIDQPESPETAWDPEPGFEAATEPAADSQGLDALTGLLDNAAFTRLVVTEDLRVQRYHRPATVVVFELGGLDRFIARLGADAADRVIPALADTMRRLARDVDCVARLAPGRFGVLLPETDEVAAINYVERVRRACELWLESGAIALTLAVGWAGTDGDPTLVEAQRLATERMYVELRRESRRATDVLPR